MKSIDMSDIHTGFTYKLSQYTMWSYQTMGLFKGGKLEKKHG